MGLARSSFYQVAAAQYRPQSSRILGCLLDGVARHTQEGLDFVHTAQIGGPMEAVRRRD